jgi:amidohydrolase
MHNWPLLPVGKMSVRTGPIMGSADEFDITIVGKGGHAAIPNQTVDPIFIASQVIVALQGAVSRVSDPVKPSVLSVTQFNSGSAYNVIPDTATLAGTIRTLDEDTREKMNDTLYKVTNNIVESFGGTCKIEIEKGYPVTVNTKEETEFAAKVAAGLLGNENVVRDLEPTMGAEDFSYMLQENPGCYVWLGQGITDNDYMVHHPLYDFNDEILPIGTSFFVRLVEESLKCED